MSRSDRELLELAAKAAGRHVVGWNDQGGVEVAVLDDGTYFQPLHENGLTDCMGDALRLAVELGLIVEAGRCYRSAYGPMFGEDVLQGARTATRRAVVRAAAEIGASK